jgi:hypothetical protein
MNQAGMNTMTIGTVYVLRYLHSTNRPVRKFSKIAWAVMAFIFDYGLVPRKESQPEKESCPFTIPNS